MTILRLNYLCLVVLLMCTACSVEPPLKLRSAHDDEAEHILAIGTGSLRAGKLAEALTAFSLVAEILPGDPRGYDGMGAVHFRLGDYKQAGFLFRKALALDSDYGPAYAHQALLAEKAGDLSAARELYRRSIAIAPLMLESRVNYAISLCEKAQAPDSERDEFDECVRQAGISSFLASRVLPSD